MESSTAGPIARVQAIALGLRLTGCERDRSAYRLMECPQPDGNYVSNQLSSDGPPNVRSPGPKRHRTWPWVAASLATILGVVFGAVTAVTSLKVGQRGPTEQVQSFLESIEDQRYDDAYSHLCPDTQQLVDREQFEALVADTPVVLPATITSLGFGSTNVYVSTDIYINDSPLSFKTSEVDGDWKVCEWRLSSGRALGSLSP